MKGKRGKVAAEEQPLLHRIQPRNSQKDCPLGLLPPELLLRIISLLSLADRLSVSLMCWRMNQLACSWEAGGIGITFPLSNTAVSNKKITVKVRDFFQRWGPAIEAITITPRRPALAQSQVLVHESDFFKRSMPHVSTLSFGQSAKNKREKWTEAHTDLSVWATELFGATAQTVSISGDEDRYCNLDRVWQGVWAHCPNITKVAAWHAPAQGVVQRNHPNVKTLHLRMDELDIRDGDIEWLFARVKYVTCITIEMPEGPWKVRLSALSKCEQLTTLYVVGAGMTAIDVPPLPKVEKMVFDVGYLDPAGLGDHPNVHTFSASALHLSSPFPPLRTSVLKSFSLNITGATAPIGNIGFLLNSRDTLRKLSLHLCNWSGANQPFVDFLPLMKELRTLELVGMNVQPGAFCLVNHPELRELLLDRICSIVSLGPRPNKSKLGQATIVGCSKLVDIWALVPIDNTISDDAGTGNRQIDSGTVLPSPHRAEHTHQGVPVDGARTMTTAVLTSTLVSVKLVSCPRIDDITPFVGCTALESLEIVACHRLVCADDLARCPSVRKLSIRDCPDLKAITLADSQPLVDVGIDNCVALKSLRFIGCKALSHVRVTNCPYITDLEVTGCPSVCTIGGIECHRVEQLTISDCASLPVGVHLGRLASARNITINAVGLRGEHAKLYLGAYRNLETVSIVGCSGIETVGSHTAYWPADPPLAIVTLEDCPDLFDVSALEHCPRLAAVRLVGLPRITGLGCLGRHRRLGRVAVGRMPQLDLTPLATCTTRVTVEHVDATDDEGTAERISLLHVEQQQMEGAKQAAEEVLAGTRGEIAQLEEELGQTRARLDRLHRVADMLTDTIALRDGLTLPERPTGPLNVL